MIFVFGAFVLNHSPEVKMFGLGLAFAVLVDATIVRMMLVPSIMEILGDANWWFPKWLGFLPRLDIDRAKPTPRRPRRARTEPVSAAWHAELTPVRSRQSSSSSTFSLGRRITACSPPEHHRALHELGVLEEQRDDLLPGLVVAGVETELAEPLVLAHQRRRRVGDGIDDPLEVGARRVGFEVLDHLDVDAPLTEDLERAARLAAHRVVVHPIDCRPSCARGYRRRLLGTSGNVDMGGRATASATSSA